MHQERTHKRPRYYDVPIYEIQLVRDSVQPVPDEEVTTPEKAVAVMRGLFENRAFETFVLMCLDSKNKVINVQRIDEGDIHEVKVSLRKIAYIALHTNAAGIIVAHNHPSGEPSPSMEDVRFYKYLAKSLEPVQVRLLDAIIIGDGTGKHYSMRTRTYGI